MQVPYSLVFGSLGVHCQEVVASSSNFINTYFQFGGLPHLANAIIVEFVGSSTTYLSRSPATLTVSLFSVALLDTRESSSSEILFWFPTQLACRTWTSD